MSPSKSLQASATHITDATLSTVDSQPRATGDDHGAVGNLLQNQANSDREAQLSTLRTLSESETERHSLEPLRTILRDVKRSERREYAQLSLLPDNDAQGVGARQADPPPQPGGGGYLDICDGSEFEKKRAAKKIARDPRLDELRRVGLQRVWVDIAEQIGVDAFLTAWRLLDADSSCSDDGTNLRIPLRRYSAFLRYQRNRYIETLAAGGLKPMEIQQRIARQLCERLTVRHIQRLIPKEDNRA